MYSFKNAYENFGNFLISVYHINSRPSTNTFVQNELALNKNAKSVFILQGKI